MSKHRACYNCIHYEDRGIDQMPMGARPEDRSGMEVRTTSFAPRCLKGLNPSLAHAMPFMGERVQGRFEPDTMAAFCDDYLWAPREAGDRFRAYVRERTRNASRFSTINLPLKFVKFWEKGSTVRIKIERGENFKYTECGFVGVSVGWEPSFLLVRSVKTRGSIVLLCETDRIVGVREWSKPGYKVYREVA